MEQLSRAASIAPSYQSSGSIGAPLSNIGCCVGSGFGLRVLSILGCCVALGIHPLLADGMLMTSQRVESASSTLTKQVTKEFISRTVTSSGTLTKQVERQFYEA